ncbi:MAG: 2-iminoacetate synthase ThiH [Coriobacteriales bacterium]|nr:2-iminoacetate synthase ThiH [Coriobacteriales bacterium]
MRDIMDYYDDMEILTDSPIKDQVLAHVAAFDENAYTAVDVEAALQADYLTPSDFAALLSPAAEPFIPRMAKRAKYERDRYFGNSVFLFSPLYIANYCENRCVYCGFNAGMKIDRARLDDEEIEKECKAMAATGLEEVLMLTGESPTYSDIDYIANACRIASKYFKNVGIEVYPVNVEDYRKLHEAGADFVTVFQETYDKEAYAKYHLGGRKRIFPYRFDAQERALRGGMRGVGFSALLGLTDFRKDTLATGLHAWYLQRAYPHAEISLSCPRLRPTINNERINPMDVHEAELLQIVCAYRLFMPFASITISTRENARVRDNLIGICTTKISADSKTGVGEHSQPVEEQGDGQFEIDDNRTFDQVYDAIIAHGLQPVMSDYIYV